MGSYGPFPVTVTTRINTFLVGNPYKPLFVTGKGPHPRYPHCKWVSTIVLPFPWRDFLRIFRGEGDIVTTEAPEDLGGLGKKLLANYVDQPAEVTPNGGLVI